MADSRFTYASRRPQLAVTVEWRVSRGRPASPSHENQTAPSLTEQTRPCDSKMTNVPGLPEGHCDPTLGQLKAKRWVSSYRKTSSYWKTSRSPSPKDEHNPTPSTPYPQLRRNQRPSAALLGAVGTSSARRPEVIVETYLAIMSMQDTTCVSRF